MIKIKIGGPQATVELNARRALDGSLLIMDHQKIEAGQMHTTAEQSTHTTGPTELTKASGSRKKT